MEELIKKVQELSKKWNIHNADPKAQFVKLIEEIGELANGINKQNNALIEDSIGDSLVVLIILCQQLGFDLKECLAVAYNEIKDRKGKVINGTFVKESDIKC